MVKWWDLDNQHCFKTMVGHRTEVRVGSWAPEKFDKAKSKRWFLLWPSLVLFTVHTDLCAVLRDSEVDWEEAVPATGMDVAFLVLYT